MLGHERAEERLEEGNVDVFVVGLEGLGRGAGFAVDEGDGSERHV